MNKPKNLLSNIVEDMIKKPSLLDELSSLSTIYNPDNFKDSKSMEETLKYWFDREKLAEFWDFRRHY